MIGWVVLIEIDYINWFIEVLYVVVYNMVVKNKWTFLK